MERKQNKLCVIAIFLAATMLFSSAPGANATSKEQDVGNIYAGQSHSVSEEEKTIEQLVADQAQAVAANQTLMQYFFDNGWVTEYPEYYGGCYIEDNVLHVRLVSPTKQMLNILDDIFAPYKSSVAYEYGQYSLSDLQKYANEIASTIRDLGYGVTHWTVDNVTGQIVIGVCSEDLESVNALIKQQPVDFLGIDVPQIIVEKGSYAVSSSGSIIGGSMIEMGTGTRSAGVCGYYNGDMALVTCGHGGTTINSQVAMNGNTIGRVEYVRFSNNGAGDFSIVLLQDVVESHKIGNATFGYKTISDGTYLAPAVGTYVIRYGYRTGYSYGVVTETNCSTFMDGETNLIGLTQVRILRGNECLPGDSGGPYLVGNAFCGIHNGFITDDPSLLLFTPYSLIAVVGFEAISAHDCTIWLDAGASTHSGYCSICREVVYEAHSDYWSNSLAKCLRCGRTDPITDHFG